MHPLLLTLLMGGSRFAYRSWKEHRLYGPAKMRGQPVLVIGAGEAADSLLREMQRSGLWYAVALIDDNPSKQGRRLRGLPVYGPLDSIAQVADNYAECPPGAAAFCGGIGGGGRALGDDHAVVR
jgi:FlaA1/EpsC-like NDP-sugar epimerase